MTKVKTCWHTEPLREPKTGIALNAYKRFLTNQGLRYETIGLYMGRVGKFLEFEHSIEPHTSKADEFREFLIDQGLSASHINNTCFAIKKFYEMQSIVWSFKVLKTNDGIPYYFDETDVLKIFSACSNIKHLAMLQTLFYGCLRSSELCRLEDTDLDLSKRTLRLRQTKGGRDDVAFITEDCAETLRVYLNIRPKIEIEGRTPLFYTDYGNFWAKGDVHRMFLYYKEKAYMLSILHFNLSLFHSNIA